ncbi:MAG: IS630 family transposase [Mariprofundaceae bacterium]|nr:IS630 family transposase [Mariprofundaceae bacterium]
MREINLTTKQIIMLKERHKKCREQKECDRIKAILLRDKGWERSKIAEALLIHEKSIKRFIDDFLDKDKLNPQSGGSTSHLNEEQTQCVIAHLCDNTYSHQHQIIAYIKDTFNIEYSIPGINKWLHQHRFSYKKPKGVPHKFDVQKQADFIEKYETLKTSLKDDEVILFMDAVHPTQATKITSGWIRKGVDKSIETTGSRTRLNVVGVIRLGHLEDTVIDRYDTVNGESIVDFLNKVRLQYSASSTIKLVLDGAGYHRSLIVKEAAEKLNIELHYLPPYSPNLNPIERLWKVMNTHARNGKYFATAKLFREKIDEFFASTLPNIADTLDSWINDNFQTLESAF